MLYFPLKGTFKKMVDSDEEKRIPKLRHGAK